MTSTLTLLAALQRLAAFMAVGSVIVLLPILFVN
jgi:hypothetical protein